MNTRKRLEKLSTELAAVRTHIVQYGGIDKSQANAIDNLATDIAEIGAAIAREAREANGDRGAKSLVKRVRKVLGYTHP